jgi:nucleoside-diphosphate kinase
MISGWLRLTSVSLAVASLKRCAATRNGYNWKGSEAIIPSILHTKLFLEAIDVTSERTLLMVKPDGVRRNLIGLIITHIEQMGLVISNMRMFRMDDAFARIFYAEHDGREYFPGLLSFMTSGPVVALQVESPNAIALVRMTIGATRPEDRLPGTIRADFSTQLTENVVHASSSLTDAERELTLVFGDSRTTLGGDHE